MESRMCMVFLFLSAGKLNYKKWVTKRFKSGHMKRLDKFIIFCRDFLCERGKGKKTECPA